MIMAKGLGDTKRKKCVCQKFSCHILKNERIGNMGLNKKFKQKSCHPPIRYLNNTYKKVVT